VPLQETTLPAKLKVRESLDLYRLFYREARSASGR
jgi:hypothetical protein